MANKIITNIGGGVMIFSIIVLVALFFNSIGFAIATGGARGQSYATFETTTIDTTKFAIGSLVPSPYYTASRRCQVSQGVTGDYGTGRLEMRGCPSPVDLSKNQVQVLALKDFYGQEVSITANAVEGTGVFYIGDFDSGNYKSLSFGQGGGILSTNDPESKPVGQSSALLEVVPNDLDPRHVDIYVNRQLVDSLELSETDQVQIAFVSNTGYVAPNGESQPGRYDLVEFNYKPLRGCDVRDGELMVTQTLQGGQNIGITDFEFDPIRFCDDLPPIIIDQQSQSSGPSFSLLTIWQTGAEEFISESHLVRVDYIMKNSDADGNPIVPIICTNATYNIDTKQCQPRIGTLVLCDGQLVNGDCVTRIAPEDCPDTSFLNELGQCIERIPSVQQACEGPIDVENGSCQGNSLSCDIGYTRQELSPGRYRCISDTLPTEVFSSQTNDVLDTVADVTEMVSDNPNKKDNIRYFVGAVMVVLFIFGFILWMAGKRKGKR